jgi:hypothetical protein
METRELKEEGMKVEGRRRRTATMKEDGGDEGSSDCSTYCV